MGRIFGTDGARGVANEKLDIRLAAQIAMAAATILRRRLGRAPTILMGRDTRISGPMLQNAMAAGFTSAGADVVLLGVVPTPAVAYLVTATQADAGVMLSASHNPYEYNGIKFFGAEGYKLSDEDEAEIEAMVLDGAEPYWTAPPDAIGTTRADHKLVGQYLRHLAGTVHTRLQGLRIAVDCANGSAAATAPQLLAMLGAEADIFCAQPDGRNINAGCGSTHIDQLAERVRAGGYDVGIAFDGDADRCLCVDERGEVVDGDMLIAIFAQRLREEGRLQHDAVVGTVMSNLGFFRFAQREAIAAHTAKVGDRYVLELMRREGYVLGGEQSGHIIFSEFMTTGDGQLSAIQLLERMVQTGKRLSELASVMTRYPQVLINVRVTDEAKARFLAGEVQPAIEEAARQLGEDGRILVRPSGTEPLIRVMVEGMDTDAITACAEQVAAQIRAL